MLKDQRFAFLVVLAALIFSSFTLFAQTKPVTVKGTLQVMVEDYPKDARVRYFLNSGEQRLELRFAKNPPKKIRSGSSVTATGTLNGTTLAMDSGTAVNLQTTSPTSYLVPNSFGAQSTLVILVNFEDNPSAQPYTQSTAYNVMFGSSGSVNEYYLENSYQQTWITGNVIGWFTIPMPSTTWNCDTGTLMNDANMAATAAGTNVSSYAHVVYAFPSSSACNWWGLGTIGGAPQTQAWINGPFETKVVSHEMGHNFGLYHSHAWDCGSTTLGSSCSPIEYGNTLDTMGNPTTGHLSSFQKERLGWLNYSASPPIQTVTSNGTYTIGPYENQDGTTKTLKILQSTDPSTGADTYYYVEFRQSIGLFDDWPTNTNVLDGVVVGTGSDGTPDSSELLNMQPSSGCCGTPALDAGQSFTDVASGITLQTVSTSSSGATVSVTFGVPACAHATPGVVFTPNQSQIVMPGSAVSFTVSITNNDNVGCSSSLFGLAGSVPAGWTAALATSTLTLAPGAVGTATLQVISPSSATSGLYNVSLSATNSSVSSYAYSGSGTGVYVLNTTPCMHANPTLTLSPPTTSGLSAGTQQVFQLEIYNNDNSVCTSSTFNISNIAPTGWTTSLGIPWLTIAPGNFAGTYVYVTSPASAASGSYPVVVNVATSTSTGEAASTSANYVLGSASTPTPAPTPQLKMSVATNASSYKPGQSVVISAQLTNGTSAVAGAPVAIMITRSNGSTISMSGSTSSAGALSVSYSVRKKDPAGTWGLSSSATTSQGTAQAATSFAVQ